MSEQERRELLAKMDASIEQTKSETPEQTRERLAREGYIDSNGELKPEYGGPLKDR